MSSLSAEAATKVASASASASGSSVRSECLKEISDISNYPDLQNGQDTSSQKQKQKQKKKNRSRRRGRRGRVKKLPEEQGILPLLQLRLVQEVH
ncbi:hypothetical protein ACHAWC_004891 [Mediolabrus comicus]